MLARKGMFIDVLKEIESCAIIIDCNSAQKMTRYENSQILILN